MKCETIEINERKNNRELSQVHKVFLLLSLRWIHQKE